MKREEIEELRYDVAVHLLNQMSPESQFHFALDKLLANISDYSEKDLRKILKPTKQKKTKGVGF